MVEIVKENKAYENYLHEEFYTTIFHLYELYYNILKSYDEETAREIFYQFQEFLIEVENEAVFEASRLKLEKNKSSLSYADALGYVISLQNNMKFLTGDKAFFNVENVEFVK
jgi:predicted nucleic acid-binding protein